MCNPQPLGLQFERRALLAVTGDDQQWFIGGAGLGMRLEEHVGPFAGVQATKEQHVTVAANAGVEFCGPLDGHVQIFEVDAIGNLHNPCQWLSCAKPSAVERLMAIAASADSSVCDDRSDKPGLRRRELLLRISLPWLVMTSGAEIRSLHSIPR